MLTRDDEVVGSVLFGAAAPFESSFARKFVVVLSLMVRALSGGATPWRRRGRAAWLMIVGLPRAPASLMELPTPVLLAMLRCLPLRQHAAIACVARRGTRVVPRMQRLPAAQALDDVIDELADWPDESTIRLYLWFAEAYAVYDVGPFEDGRIERVLNVACWNVRRDLAGHATWSEERCRAELYVRREDIPLMNRGDAADMDTSRRRVAATPWVPRG